MARLFTLHRTPRILIAGVVGLAGVLVSLSMVLQGGDMARHLPDQGFHVAAFIGAVLAGLLLADGFGQVGRKGVVWSALWFMIATLVGAGLGGSIGMLVVMSFLEPWYGSEVNAAIRAVPMLVAFGWIAVLDGVTTSAAVAVTWAIALSGVHLAAGRIRRHYPYPFVLGADAF